MSQAVTSDSALLTIYKSWYTDKKFENLLFRNSPLARKIQKNRIGGKEYRFSALYERTAAVSGDYSVAVTIAASSQSKNAEFIVPPGKIFSVFTINQLEIMASREKRGAYIKAAVDRMFGALEATRKMFAACVYGSGYGDLGQCNTVAAAATTMDVRNSVGIKLSVGMQFEVAATTPAGTLYGGGPYTVTALDSTYSGAATYTTVTFSPGATAVTGWVAGSWIVLRGGRDGSGNPNMLTGLGGWVPSYFARTGASWTTYIGTSFYNVVRNVSTSRLAGNFIHRDTAGAEKYSDALMRAIRAVRAQGGVPNLLVINDEDWFEIQTELLALTQGFQQVNTSPAKGDKNVFQRGLSDMGFQFSTSWLQYVIDDPYCPKGLAYILDEEVVEFVGLTNVDAPLNDGIEGNNPGSQDVDAVTDPSSMNYNLIIDDYLDVRPGTDTSDGPAARVSLNLYGNFAVHNPAHCAVVQFTANLYD